MALLHYLINNYKDKIIVAHINHNVRKQSNTEELFLSNYCKDNNITFECMKITEYKENNFENEARKKRYKFYKEILTKYNSSYLFLAHHADDLMETIIMKITRGSNINGYAGIKKISYQDNYYIVRPFLDYTKQDILEYIKKYNITYYDDYTNNDITYTRNRIRHNIIPLLKKEDINIYKKFIKYSNTLNEYNDYNPKPNITINMPNNIYVTKEYNILIFSNKYNIENYNIKFDKKASINNFTIEQIENTSLNGNDICRLNSNEIRLPLYIRNKKDGDYIELLGLNKKKKIKEIFIECKIPIRQRNNYPVLVDSKNNILWLPNLKKSKFNKKINEKYDIILKYITNKEENNE